MCFAAQRVRAVKWLCYIFVVKEEKFKVLSLSLRFGNGIRDWSCVLIDKPLMFC